MYLAITSMYIYPSCIEYTNFDLLLKWTLAALLISIIWCYPLQASSSSSSFTLSSSACFYFLFQLFIVVNRFYYIAFGAACAASARCWLCCLLFIFTFWSRLVIFHLADASRRLPLYFLLITVNHFTEVFSPLSSPPLRPSSCISFHNVLVLVSVCVSFMFFPSQVCF